MAGSTAGYILVAAAGPECDVEGIFELEEDIIRLPDCIGSGLHGQHERLVHRVLPNCVVVSQKTSWTTCFPRPQNSTQLVPTGDCFFLLAMPDSGTRRYWLEVLEVFDPTRSVVYEGSSHFIVTLASGATIRMQAETVAEGIAFGAMAALASQGDSAGKRRASAP